MSPDTYQLAWRAQSSQTRVTVDADLLLEKVERSQRNFRATIFWRDFREVGVALLLVPAWFVLGITLSLPWTWYLTVPALLWVVGFILVDRRRHKHKPSELGEPLLQSATESLTQLEHQIWLLRNVFWWYLLPFIVSILPFFAQVTWLSSKNWLQALIAGGFSVAFIAVLYAFIFYMNQYAVRSQLEPRRRELLGLLASLGDETLSEVSDEYPILVGADREECSASPRRKLIANLCFLVIVVIGIPGILFVAFRLDQGSPKKSPFAAVRWQQSQPEVKVGDEWFRLISLDNLPASEIVAFSQRTFGDRWQKRFEEDLVELLTRMGHPPQDTVRLVVQSLTSAETRTLDDVPMTSSNRRAIRDAAQARERKGQ